MKLKGFHSYSQSLQESVDWCTQEQARQIQQYERIKSRARFTNIEPYREKIRSISDEIRAINARMKLLPNDMPLHIYRMRRVLLKSRNLLNQITEMTEN